MDEESAPTLERVHLIARARYHLKVLLYELRTLPGERGPRCAMCSYLQRKFDMHEVLIPRRYVQQMPPERRVLVHVKENCVLVCRDCHTYAGTKHGATRCIQHLLAWEGYDTIQSWLESLLPVFRGDAVRLAMNRLAMEVDSQIVLNQCTVYSWTFDV